MPEVEAPVEDIKTETSTVQKPEVKAEEKPPVPGTPEAEAAAVEELQALIDAKAEEAAPVEEDKNEPAEVEESEEAKEQPKEAAAPESPSAGIPPKLAFRASKVMDESEFAELADDPKALERVVSALERRNKDSSTQKPTAKADERQADDEIPDLSEDDVAEPIAKAWKAIKGAVGKLLESHKASQEAHANLLNMYTYNREGERFDRAVSKLGQADVFGDGDIESLDEGSEQYKNRLELFKARQEVRAQYVARHEKIPTESKLVERAYRIAFPQKIEQTANKTLAEKLKAGAKKLSIPPTRRKSAANATPDELALEAMQAVLDAKNK